ncbi:MAG: hypothetical protein LW645_10120 [Verrucomicrobiaceae bacterium]|nr:hypothetical protein [Verrucomicrobiaceae bacterium]
MNQLAAHAFPEFSTQTNSTTGVAGEMTPSPRWLKSLALLLLATPTRTAFTAMAGFVCDEADRGKFKMPSLRKSAQTAPYMHDGQFGTLEEVVERYSTGACRSATLDPKLAMHPVAGIQSSEQAKAT